MNKIAHLFWSSKLWAGMLRLTGRVPAGFYVGWGHWMTLAEAQACVGPGWAGLVKEGFDICLKYGLRIYQIKEKFGGLRFYCEDDRMVELLGIEGRSYTICEECGAPGKDRPGGWIKTLCEYHALEQQKYRRRERSWQ
jgi:hypothetical protein